MLTYNGNNGKTLCSYFSKWPISKLSQLYFHYEIPTTNICENYFRLTDFDQVCSMFFLTKFGTIFNKNDINSDLVSSRADRGWKTIIYHYGREKMPLACFCRELLWSLNMWKSTMLNNWIRRCSPDVIFFASGDYSFPFRIVYHISRELNIPIATCVFDDYYFYTNHNEHFLTKARLNMLRNKLKGLFKESKEVFYVHPEMKKQYDKHFLKNGHILYTVARINNLPEPYQNPLKISYMGNLGLHRDDALVEVGRALLSIVQDGSLLIDVYSSEKRSKILEKMVPSNGLRFCGEIPYSEVLKVIEESNILIFAEARNPELLDRLRFSLSTKIPDYLGSNRCILAYGPRGAGSIDYLLDNEVACVATDPMELKVKMEEILFSASKRRRYAEQQMKLALRNHTQERNSEVLRQALLRAAKSSGESA